MWISAGEEGSGRGWAAGPVYMHADKCGLLTHTTNNGKHGWQRPSNANVCRGVADMQAGRTTLSTPMVVNATAALQSYLGIVGNAF